MMNIRKLLVLSCCSLACLSAGCASNPPVPAGSGTAARNPNMVCRPLTKPEFPAPLQNPQAALSAAEAEKKGAPAVAQGADTAAAKSEQFSPIYFGFDSYLLEKDARDTLERLYQVVKGDSVSYIIEGYCDERGDDQYNIALGERRATAVRSYLVTRGVDAGRLSVMSYGRENPVDPGHNEAAWRKNRRVEIVGKDGAEPLRSAKVEQ